MATIEEMEKLALDNVQQQFMKAAEEVARRLCEFDPDNRIGRMVLAMAEGSTGRLDQAQNDIEVALRGGSNDGRVLSVARSIYQRTGNAAADADIARRISLHPAAPAMEFTRHFLRADIVGHGWEIGDWTYGRPVVHAKNQAKLRVGRFCSFGPGVTIYLGDNHRTDWATTYPFSDLGFAWPEAADIKGHPASRGDVVIGHDVWLAHGAMVLSGVTIGNGAVVGAGAVVVDDLPPYAIALGNPARVVARRFKQPQIEELQRIAWWDWPESKIRQAMPLLLSTDIDGLIAFADGGSDTDGGSGETAAGQAPDGQAG